MQANKQPLHSNARAEHPERLDVEAALAAMATRPGGLERLVAIAWSAGRHGEVNYEAWLDNTIAAFYRGRKQQHSKEGTA